MANVINGTDFCLFIGTGTTKKCIGLATSCKLDLNMDTRKIASKDSGIWNESAEGRMNWTVDSDNLLTTDVLGTSGATFKDLMTTMIARTSVTISLGSVASIGAYPQVLGASYYTGVGRLTKVSLNAPDNENSSFTISIEGTGALSIV